MFMYNIGIYNEEGKEVLLLEEGVICVKLDECWYNGIFIEYLEDVEWIGKVFKYGLYYIGDKVYKDEDGFIWFIGCNDDVIKVLVYCIGFFEVESVLVEYFDVVEVVVVVSLYEMWGYVVKVFVIFWVGV